MVTKLSRRARLTILALTGVVALIFFLNYYANLNWLGGYDWYATLTSLALLLFAIILVAEGKSDRRST
jgi:hypothetical protein